MKTHACIKNFESVDLWCRSCFRVLSMPCRIQFYVNGMHTPVAGTLKTLLRTVGPKDSLKPPRALCDHVTGFIE